MDDLGLYLGMPSHVGRDKASVFKMLKDRIWDKLNGWTSKLLSKAGKEVLIKAVAQAIPNYVMSCFKVSNSVLHDLNAMIGRFWWGKQGGKRGMAWINWTDMCVPKLQGGLGFRDFGSFNDALLC